MSGLRSARDPNLTMDERLKILYPMVNEEETPLPRCWSFKDKFNYIGLSQVILSIMDNLFTLFNSHSVLIFNIVQFCEMCPILWNMSNFVRCVQLCPFVKLFNFVHFFCWFCPILSIMSIVQYCPLCPIMSICNFFVYFVQFCPFCFICPAFHVVQVCPFCPFFFLFCSIYISIMFFLFRIIYV